MPQFNTISSWRKPKTRERIEKLIRECPENKVIIITDFGMKLSNFSPNQINSEFYASEQYSNQGFVVIINSKGEIKTKKFAMLSENLKQTAILAIAGISKLLKDPKFKDFVGNRENLDIISDGASQFNNFQWFWLFVDLVMKNDVPEDVVNYIKGLDEVKTFETVEINFYVPGHGKRWKIFFLFPFYFC